MIFSRKNMPKNAKIKDLGSQTRPETLPKSIQNRYSKKHMFFLQFFNEICHMLQWLNLKIRAPTQCFVSFSNNLLYCLEHTFLVQKTFQKPFQNEGRALEKSMPKTCCFLTSIFRVSVSILEGLGLPSPPRCLQRLAC